MAFSDHVLGAYSWEGGSVGPLRKSLTITPLAAAAIAATKSRMILMVLGFTFMGKYLLVINVALRPKSMHKENHPQHQFEYSIFYI